MTLRAAVTLLAVVCTCFAACTNKDITLPAPNGTEGLANVGIIFISGAYICAEAYVPLVTAIQATAASSQIALFAAIPSFPDALPNPLAMPATMQRALASLVASGMHDGSPIVAAAHSLGAVVLQDYVASANSSVRVVAQVLAGAGLARSYVIGKNFSVATFSVSGELDGLYRVTRQAESFHRQVQNAPNASMALQYPVVVIPGMSHMQVASGTPPENVKMHDLQPEISYDAAHKELASLTAAYITLQLKGEAASPSAVQTFTSAMNQTTALVQPLIDAFLLEGNPHFRVPCNTDQPLDLSRCPFYPRFPGGDTSNTPNPPNCFCGTPWTESVSQLVMGNQSLSSKRIFVVDGVHSVADEHPIHLPHLWHNCSIENTSCTINVTTVTEPVFSAFDVFDTGFYFESASELRTKLLSRQHILQGLGVTNAEFNITDAPNICAFINQNALLWASQHAPAKTTARFQKLGQPLVVGDDLGPYNAGPLWIYHPMEYHVSQDKSHVTVNAPMMKTPTNFWLPLAAGYHYCKVLSPARAIEWLYIDGLRTNDSLAELLSTEERRSKHKVSVGSCPELTGLRGQSVIASSFQESRLRGFRYEQAYIDPAQVGSQCPRGNTTVSSDGKMSMAFSVHYDKAPFTIVEDYTPLNATGGVEGPYVPGYFRKRVEAPGSQLLELNLVVVDVIGDDDDDSKPYDAVTLYSCTEKFNLKIEELQFFTTNMSLSSDLLAQMKANARSAGVVWSDSDLKTASQAC